MHNWDHKRDANNKISTISNKAIPNMFHGFFGQNAKIRCQGERSDCNATIAKVVFCDSVYGFLFCFWPAILVYSRGSKVHETFVWPDFLTN